MIIFKYVLIKNGDAHKQQGKQAEEKSPCFSGVPSEVKVIGGEDLLLSHSFPILIPSPLLAGWYRENPCSYL